MRISLSAIIFVSLITICKGQEIDKKSKVDKINQLLDFVMVEGGTFTMGDNSLYCGKIDKNGNLTSVKSAIEHEVELSNFYMQTTEVTQELWILVMGNIINQKDTGFNLPVRPLNWEECNNFIRELNKITGKKYRLPTEAEWEYAARGGKFSMGYQYSGSDNLNEVAWNRRYSNVKIHPVAQKKPNELCLYDMSGNVWEWCQDWYKDYSLKTKKNPKGPKKGITKVIRGGNCVRESDFCKVAQRMDIKPEAMYYSGFRLAFSVD